MRTSKFLKAVGEHTDRPIYVEIEDGVYAEVVGVGKANGVVPREGWITIIQISDPVEED